MRTILTLAILAAMFLAGGCGQQLAPGGTTQFEYTKVGVNGKPDVKVGFICNKDTAIMGATNAPGLKVDLEKGTIQIQSMTGNGSTLGGIQGDASVKVAEIQAKSFDNLVNNVIGPILQKFIGGGTTVVTGGGTVTPTPDLTALKATLTARIDACPFLATNPALRDKLKAQVAAVNSQAGADVLQGVVDSLYATAAPAAVKAPK